MFQEKGVNNMNRVNWLNNIFKYAGNYSLVALLGEPKIQFVFQKFNVINLLKRIV